MANPFLEPHKGLRRAYDAVQPKLNLPKLPTEATSNLRLAGSASSFSGGGQWSGSGASTWTPKPIPKELLPSNAPPVTEKAPGVIGKTVSGIRTVVKAPVEAAGAAKRGLRSLSKPLEWGGGAANTGKLVQPEAQVWNNMTRTGAASANKAGLLRNSGRALGALGAAFDGYQAYKSFKEGDALGGAYDATNAAASAASMIPGPVGALAGSYRLGGVIGSAIEPHLSEDVKSFIGNRLARGANMLNSDWGVSAEEADRYEMQRAQDRVARVAQPEQPSKNEPKEAGQPARPTQAAPQQPTITRLRDPQTGQAIFTDGSSGSTDRISTVPGFFEGGENSAFARGERYVQSLRDIQNLRAQLMDQGKPTPGTAIIGPASGGNAALDLRRLADEQRNTPSAVVDRLRRGEINDRVAASLLDSHDRAQERLMRGELGRREQDMNLRAEQERAALRLASESGTRGRKGGEEGEGLGFKDRLALAKFQADLAKDQREQRNADREFARNAENDEYGRRSAQQRDFMDRVDREFTELDKDGKPFINTARRNEFLRFADQSIADGIRQAETDLQANPNNSEARAQLQAMLRNPYQTIDPRQYRELAALQEVDRLAREHGSYVASGTADGKRIVGKEDSWIPFKEYYVTRDGSRVPTYVTDYQDGGYFSRAWKPKRTDLHTVMDIHPRG